MKKFRYQNYVIKAPLSFNCVVDKSLL